MKIIGITGGVGAGKSEVLTYIANKYQCHIMKADEVAHHLQKQGHPCYDKLVRLLGKEILDQDGNINRIKMASLIFEHASILEAVNHVIHPAVREMVCAEIEAKKKEKSCDFFFIEAALLIEAGYQEVVDELWYIYADLESRTKRLMESRGYTKEKVESIHRNQLSEETFRRQCSVIIDNSGKVEDTWKQIDSILGEYQ